MDDRELLREFVGHHSEQAFTELVARHLPGVLATAQRLVHESHTAADVAQMVFIQLARKGWTIRDGQTLSGWLYRATRHTALNALRLEQRRRERETNAMNDAEIQTGSEPGWEHLAPLVDEAMQQLKRPEQDVVLLRFFEGKSFGEIGGLLGLDEKTAGQRANRALEKMRLYFSRRGVTTTAVLLGSALGAHGATTLPAGMTAQVAGASLASTGGATPLAVFLKTLYMTTTTKIILAGAVLVAVATFSTLSQQREIYRLRAELAAKNTTTRPSTSAKKSWPPSASDLARAKADLAKILQTMDKTDRERELLDYVNGLDARTVEAVLSDFETKKPLTPEIRHAMDVLCARWTKLDPKAALAWAQSLPSSVSERSLLNQVFDTFSTQNPAAALATLTELKYDANTDDEMKTVIQNFVQQNPSAALAAIGSMPISESYQLYTELFRGWAQVDPSSAAAAALNLSPSVTRNRSLQDIASAWAILDPTAAFTWIKSLPAGPTQNNAAMDAVDFASLQDPAVAANYFIQLNLPAGPYRDAIIQDVTSNWSQTDPVGLLTWADQNLSGAPYETAAEQALDQLGNSDPAAAAAALSQISDLSIIKQATAILALNWAQLDPQAALAWAQSLPADNAAVRNDAVADVFGVWSTANPVAAANYVQQNFATDPAFGTIVTGIANKWAQNDPQAALTWAEGLPAGNGQSSAMVAAMTQLAQVDPQTAWADAQQLSDSSMGKAEVNVINAWASQQPAQAAAALQSLPDGSNLNTATADVAKSWLQQDPNAASQWIDTLPQGTARDGAVTQLVASVGTNDPASAFPWALSISNPTTENAQVVKLATQWSSQNPNAAAAAVQNAMGNLTGLTQAQQNALQKVLDKAAGP